MYKLVFIVMCLSGVASSQTQHLCNCYCNNPQKGQKNECFLSINKERCCHVSYMQNRVHNLILIKVQICYSFQFCKLLQVLERFTANPFLQGYAIWFKSCFKLNFLLHFICKSTDCGHPMNASQRNLNFWANVANKICFSCT